MAKVEVLFQGGAHRVQVTFREPFEYFFEIAVHNARFAHPRDANRLADRVRAALRENGLARSHSFVIGRAHWSYRSSAYDARMGTEGAEFDAPASEAAQAADAAYDRAH